MPDDAPDPTTAAQDRAREGIDHLQNAARELIAAARAALDVAEDLIDDPDTITSVIGPAGQLGALGDLVRHLLPTSRVGRDAEGDDDSFGDTGRGRGGAAGTEPGVQRIEVV